MSDTTAATEARKQQALVKKKEVEIKKRYGQYLPDNTIDPIGVYRLWQKSIFAELPDDIPPDDTIMYFVVSQAAAAGIDARIPRQIYAIPYKNHKTGQVKWTTIIGIEGMVTIAERTGMYGGCTKPEYEFGVDETGAVDRTKIISCTIGVQKVVQGIVTTSYATAYFDEYDTGKNLWVAAEGETKQNQKGESYQAAGGKPKTMIAKVARAQALRATFSACAGLYIAEEVERGDIIDGELVVPDVRKRIEAATTRSEFQEVLSSLSVEDKKRVAPLISERLKELS
jgi:phage recombination protein Bet